MDINDLPPNFFSIIDVSSKELIDYLDPDANHVIMLAMGHAIGCWLNCTREQMLQNEFFVEGMRAGGIQTCLMRGMTEDEANDFIETFLKQFND